MDTTLEDSFDSLALEQQLGIQFALLSGGGGTSSNNTALSSSFSTYSLSSIHLSGGNTSAYNPQDWNDWIHTVYYDPIPLSRQLAPISMLADSPIISMNLRDQVDAYVAATALSYCAVDQCNNRGSCSSNGTPNPMESCECNPNFTGSNCTVPLALEQQLYHIGPFCSYDHDLVSSCVAAPGDSISAVALFKYSDILREIVVFFDNETACAIGPGHHAQVETDTFYFDGPIQVLQVGCEHSISCSFCSVTIHPYVSVIDFEYVQQLGGPSFTVPPKYEIVGLEAFWSSTGTVISSLGAVYRKSQPNKGIPITFRIFGCLLNLFCYRS